jgi:hypothetical protein
MSTKNNVNEQRLSSIERSLASIDKTLAVNTEHLSEHIRRTAIIEKELAPVVKHVHQMQGAGKLLGLLALVATIMGALIIFR